MNFHGHSGHKLQIGFGLTWAYFGGVVAFRLISFRLIAPQLGLLQSPNRSLLGLGLRLG